MIDGDRSLSLVVMVLFRKLTVVGGGIAKSYHPLVSDGDGKLQQEDSG